jgi:hypothetical protein
MFLEVARVPSLVSQKVCRTLLPVFYDFGLMETTLTKKSGGLALNRTGSRSGVRCMIPRSGLVVLRVHRLVLTSDTMATGNAALGK